MPRDFPAPIVLVQHIAAEYAENLAQWLRSQTGLNDDAARLGAPEVVPLSAPER